MAHIRQRDFVNGDIMEAVETFYSPLAQTVNMVENHNLLVKNKLNSQMKIKKNKIK